MENSASGYWMKLNLYPEQYERAIILAVEFDKPLTNRTLSLLKIPPCFWKIYL